jgi:YesN/AraC family two-component response regulator
LRQANLGKKHTLKTRQQMQKAQRQRWTPEARRTQSIRHQGKQHSQVTRQTMGLAIAEAKQQRSILTWLLIRKMRTLYSQGQSQYVLGRRFEISRSYVGRIVRNEQWVDPTYHPRG